MPNGLLYLVTALIAALLFRLAVAFWARLSHRSCLFLLASIPATPALVFALYYTHLFDSAAWFYAFRAAEWSELSAAGLGALAGAIHASLEPRTAREKLVVPVAAALVLSVPYLKPLLAPLDFSRLHDRWSDGVCLQSTLSTCGPSSAATLLRSLGRTASEAELASECLTSASGTENWYLARAFRRRGLQTRFVIQSPDDPHIPSPAIAGVVLRGGSGHFVAILHDTPTHVTIADPLKGKMVVEKKKLSAHYRFTGFFLTVR